MALENNAVFGIFNNTTEVESAISELNQQGFANAKIAVQFPSGTCTKNLRHERTTTMIRSGVCTGGTVGGLVAFFGLLFNYSGVITFAFLPMPRALMSQISMSFVILAFGIIFGAAIGALIGIGTLCDIKNPFSDYKEVKGIVLSVHIENADEGRIALELLEDAGAKTVSLLPEDYIEDSAKSAKFI
jgi:Protein of unknown function (DUF3341)